MKVAIINYGMGNLSSVQKVFNFLKIESIITADKNIIAECDAIVLPGVGAFEQAMTNLRKLQLDKILTEEVIGRKKKFLGICLGMQLIFENGTEPLPCKGLGWLKGSVVKLNPLGLRVPHMGWNNIVIVDNTYFKHLQNNDFYFIHSYHVVPDDPNVIAATVEYGHDIVASVLKENIFAVQFHPEKSQNSGLQVLKNYFLGA